MTQSRLPSFRKAILHIVVIQIWVIHIPNLLDVHSRFSGLLVGPSMSIVTLLSTILALLISLVLGASMGKIANLSTFETCHGTSVVIGYCLFGCIYLLPLANIILGITLSLS